MKLVGPNQIKPRQDFVVLKEHKDLLFYSESLVQTDASKPQVAFDVLSVGPEVDGLVAGATVLAAASINLTTKQRRDSTLVNIGLEEYYVVRQEHIAAVISQDSGLEA